MSRILRATSGTHLPAAYSQYLSRVGSAAPLPNYNVVLTDFTNALTTPLTIDSTTYWPFSFDVGYEPTQRIFSDRVTHQFAKAVRYALDGGWAHYATYYDVGKLLQSAPADPCVLTSDRFAFVEGFASYWAELTSAGWWSPGLPLCRTKVTRIDYQEQPLARVGNVAWWLWYLSRCPGVGDRGIVNVLKQNPGKIHDFGDFYEAFRRTHPTFPAQADFLEAFLADADHPVPFCGALVLPTVVLKPATPLVSSKVITTVQAEAAKQSRLVASLISRLTQARAAATGSAATSCTTGFDVVTAAPLLEGEVARATLLRTRFSTEAASLKRLPLPTAGSRKWQARLRSRAKDFDRKNLALARTERQHATAAVSPPFTAARISRTDFSVLQQRTSQLSKLAKSGGVLPSWTEPPGAISTPPPNVTPPPPPPPSPPPPPRRRLPSPSPPPPPPDGTRRLRSPPSTQRGKRRHDHTAIHCLPVGSKQPDSPHRLRHLKRQRDCWL